MNKYIFAIALVILAKSVFGKVSIIYSALDDKYRNKNVVKVESEIKSDPSTLFRRLVYEKFFISSYSIGDQ